MKTYLPKTILSAAFILITWVVAAQCVPGFTSNQSQSNIVNFTNTSTPIIPNSTFFVWDFGDQQYDYTQSSVHTYSAPGTYVVCVTMYDSLSSCQNQFCDSVTVWGTVFCNLNAGAFPSQQASCQTCADGVAYVVAQFGTPPYTYSWSSGGTSNVESGLLPGVYTVCITDANACTACDSVSIIDGSMNSCSASYVWNQSGINTADFYSTSSGVGASTAYIWDFGDGNYGWTPNLQHTYASAGTYNVCLMIYDSLAACQSSYCDSITVTGTVLACNANFMIYPDSVNTQQAWAYNLSNGGPGMTYDWNWGDNTAHDYTAYPSHIYQFTGTYNICLIVNDIANNCSDTMCQTINVFRVTQQAAQVPYYVNVVPMGIQSHEVVAQWSLFPNPAQDVLHIKTDLHLQGRAYYISDIAGRRVNAGTIEGSSISISTLDAGTYILQVENSNGGFTAQRFIKN